MSLTRICKDCGHWYPMQMSCWNCAGRYVGDPLLRTVAIPVHMTLTPPKVYYSDFPPPHIKFTTAETEMGMDWLVETVRVVVRAWYNDLMSDPSRLRFSLLELT